MKKWKWYSLPTLPTLLLTALSAVLLIVVFTTQDNGPLAYFSYLLSTYALIVVVAGLVRLIPKIGRGVTRSRLLGRLHEHERLTPYLDDPVYRTQINLYFGVAVNFAYIFIKLFTGLAARSEWLIVFALYYAVLTGLRISLVNYVRRKAIRSDLIAEYRRYRLVGMLLVLMNIVLSIIIARMIGHNDTYDYPGVLIYAMAAYVFYAVIMAAVNVFRFRRHGSPIVSAIKVVSLTAALVALLSLEAAMLQRFGDADDSYFRGMMIGLSGLGVSLILLSMSIYMILHASRKLKQMGENENE